MNYSRGHVVLGSYLKVYIPIFFALFCAVLVLFFQNYAGYELLVTQPLVFIFCYFLALRRGLEFKPFRPFLFVFTLICFVRYVILPLLTVVSGHYGGRSQLPPEPDSFSAAILLMNWELVCCSLLVFFLERRRRKSGLLSAGSQGFHTGYPMPGIGVYLIFGGALILVFPSALQSVNFVVPRVVAGEIEASTLENFVAYVFLVAKSLLFLIVLKICYGNYLKSKKEGLVILCLFFASFNVLVYWGSNRSDILISAVATFLVLYRAFGARVSKYAVVGLFVLSSALFLVTQKREHVSFSGGQNPMVDVSDTFQVYTGGVYNVAIALETKEMIPASGQIKTLFVDVFRPMIGFNLLLKDLPLVYSNIYFNQRLWQSVDRRSQILPMVGQGNLYFGFLFAPLLSLAFIFLAYKIEGYALGASNVFVYYFLCLALVRLGFMMGQNTMNMVNDISMNLFLFFVVYLFNYAVVRVFGRRRF